MHLETERLMLRRFTAADAQHIFDLDNDPEVMRYINGGTPTAFDVVQNELLPLFLRYDEADPAFGFFAIIDIKTANFLGWVSLRRTEDEPQTAALGYRLCRDAWGRGVATEAARVLIDKGFANTKHNTSELTRIVATTYEKNIGSQRVMEKLGMKLIRRFRLEESDLADADTFHTESLDLWDGDDLDYALTRAEWQRIKAS